MDNVKWYKKFATIFWWSLTILPLIVALIYFIGYHLTFNSGIAQASELASYHVNSYGLFGYSFDSSLSYFNGFAITSLSDTFIDLFDLLDVNESAMFGYFFGYMLSIQIYHLLFDFLVFFVHMIHDFLDINKSRLF